MESTGGMIIVLIAMVLVMWLVIWRPENKRKKEEEAMRSGLTVGDKITSIGGIVGKIVAIEAESIVIETSKDRVRMELMKSAVATNETAAEKAKKARAEAQANARERAAQRKRDKENKKNR